MKFTAILLFAACLQVSARGYSQVTLNESNTNLQKVFKKIQKQTGYDFLYSVELLQQSGSVTVNVKNVSLEKTMEICLQGKSLSYSIVDKTVVIKPKENESPESEGQTVAPVSPPVEIKGRVVNENGEPVAGASIMVKGTKKGTTTNADGEFVLNLDNLNVTLVISSVNTETLEVPVGGKTDLGSITAKIKVVSGEGVVLNTGYQTISKERSTAAFDRVTDEILSKRPTANLSNALVGQIAGLVADPVTGFTIRGRATLSNSAADRTPLVVVDGFPIEGGFSTINPNDVLSVTVLKDAAASSIYGAKAANGVIVVVTKKPEGKGRMNVNFNSFISIAERYDLDYYMNMVDGKTQMEWEDQIYGIAQNLSAYNPYGSSTGSFRGAYSPYATLLIERARGSITQEYLDAKKQEFLKYNYKDDFNKYLIRNAVTQQQNLIISGATDRHSYKFSALYDNDKTGMQFNDNSKTVLGFSNIFNISPDIKYTLNTNLTFYNEKNNGVSLSQAKSVISPWTRLVDENGNYTRQNYRNYEPIVQTFEPRFFYPNMRYNLLEEASLRDNNYTGQDIRIQNEFEFKIFKGLKFRPMFQYELLNDKSTSLYDERSYAVRDYVNTFSRLNPTTGLYNPFIPPGAIYRKNFENKRQSLKFRAQADYSRTFGSNHEITALGGLEVITTTTDVTGPDLKFGYNKTGLNYPTFNYALDSTDMFLNAVFENTYSYEGNAIYDFRGTNFRQNYKYNERFFAGYFNAAYTYNRKYTLSVSMRTDASNYISKSVRDKFSPFYSAGLRWNIGSEEFMKNVSFVDKLALRATYGVTGNSAGKRSSVAQSVFTSTSASAETGNLAAGFITGRDNDFLTWEKTYSTNIGTDFSLFKGKLSGSIDLYRRYSKNVLGSVLTSQVVQSTSSLVMNLSEVLNKGIEVSLGSKLNISRDFTWNGVLNFDYNYNEVVKHNNFAPSLFYYYGPNGNFYIPGLPTDRLMLIKLAGTTKNGYYIQEQKNGELIVYDGSFRNFSDVTNINMARIIPGLPLKDDPRLYYHGRTTPPSTIGFTNTFNYKGFSLMSVITGRFGYKFMRYDENLQYNLYVTNFSASGLRVVQPTSTVATTSNGNVPITGLINNFTSNSNTLRNFYSDAIVEDASHIRLNEIYLGYDFDTRKIGVLSKVFRSITLYSQARNLGLLWKANDKGIDPEYRIGTLKPVKTYTFGVRLGM